MLDFLKGGKTTLTVTVDRPSPVYYPGETVQATVNLESARELKVRAGHIALIAQEDFKYNYEETDSEGDRSSGSRWGQTRHEMDRHDFLGETVFPANTHQTYAFTFVIPPTAPPSGNGSIFRLQWFVEAKLDRKLAVDVHGQANLIVLSVPPGQQVTAGEHGTSNHPNDAEIMFFLPGLEWAPGQTITGELRIYPHKEFTANEVRVELVQHEWVPREQGNVADTIAAKVKLAGKTALRADQLQRFPFQVTLPANAAPSLEGQEGTLSWCLRGILPRTLRSDVRAEATLLVYNGQRR